MGNKRTTDTVSVDGSITIFVKNEDDEHTPTADSAVGRDISQERTQPYRHISYIINHI